YAATAQPAGVHPGGNNLDRRRAGRHPMFGRSKRLAPSWTNGGADLSVASRSRVPNRARRPRDFLSGRRQDLRRTGACLGGRRNHRRTGRGMSKLVVAAIGPACSVQDHGRGGYQRYGLVASGAMDRLALAASNTLLGNEPFAAAIEIGPFTASFTARDGDVRVALCGAQRSIDIAGRAMPNDASMTLAEGETLNIGFAKGGAFSYLAIEGGIEG